MDVCAGPFAINACLHAWNQTHGASFHLRPCLAGVVAMDIAPQSVQDQRDRAGSRKFLALMAVDGSDKFPQGNPAGMNRRRAAAKSSPEWADGLKQLYDAVVEEDLPDQFLDLLAQLDEQDMPPQGRGGSSPSGQGDAR
jgi:hypothetical protein